MTRIFRTIRKTFITQSNARNYLGYAIGEVLLVVVGILIALQINNWNEGRKAKKQEIGVLQNFIQDLRADSASFYQNAVTLKDIESLHEACFQVGVHGADPAIIKKPTYIRRLLYYNPITKENDPFVANKISDKGIRSEIQTYFRIMKDMEDVYRELEDVVMNRIRIYLSDQESHEVAEWFSNKDIDSNKLIRIEELARLSARPDFQQLLLEASLKIYETTITLDQLMKQNNRLKTTIMDYLR